MKLSARIASVALLSLIASCGDTTMPIPSGSIRIVNAFTTPVDVQIDGHAVYTGLGVGEITVTAGTSGTHEMRLVPTGTSNFAALNITNQVGATTTIAAVRASNGAVGSAVLDDTNSVVPAGATKVRVIHFAPNAGTIQVMRTQPDYQTPISWQFPFNYQAEFNSLSAPFYQSTVGTWEVHVWQTPADASGWASAPIKVIIPLGSGEKKTILILDKPGGGIRFELL